MSTVGVRLHLEAKAMARGFGEPSPTLYLCPEGEFGPVQVSFSFAADMAGAQQVTIADRVLAGVQRWRDAVVKRVEDTQSIEAKLAAAEARIAELEGGEGDE